MKRIEIVLLFFLVAVFTLGFSLISVLRHFRFESFAYDLGIYDQALWLMSNFKVPISTIKNSHILGDHLIPSLYLVSPIYWFFDKVKALLIFQSFWVALGAIPVYLLAKEKLKKLFFSLILSFSYLSFFGIQNGVFFDFHPLVMAAPLLAWWLYFFEKKERIHFLIFFLLLGLQENISLLMAAFGIMFIFRRETKKVGFIIITLSLGWFLLATKIIIPHFLHGEGFAYLPQQLIFNPVFFLKEIFYPFQKTKTILLTLGNFGFLPLLYPPVLIPIFEQFTERFVGNVVATRWGTGLHYSAPLAPILVYGTIKSLEKNFFKKRKLLTYSLGGLFFLIVVFYQYFLHLPLNMLAKRDFYQLPERREQINEAMTMIGEKESVATQNNLLPHLSHREKIFTFSSCQDVPDPSRGMSCQFLIDEDSGELPLIEKEKVKLILVDLTPGQNPNNFFPDGEERLKKYMEKLLLDKKYTIKFQEKGVILLERK